MTLQRYDIFINSTLVELFFSLLPIKDKLPRTIVDLVL
jgi:hypothetical protein